MRTYGAIYVWINTCCSVWPSYELRKASGAGKGHDTDSHEILYGRIERNNIELTRHTCKQTWECGFPIEIALSLDRGRCNTQENHHSRVRPLGQPTQLDELYYNRAYGSMKLNFWWPSFSFDHGQTLLRPIWPINRDNDVWSLCVFFYP